MEINWEPVEPKVYRKGDLYQHPSYDCEQKFIATYEDGSKYAIPCNGDGTLTWQETRPDDKYKRMTYADIGLCVTEIGAQAFNGCEKLTGWTKWDNVQTIGEGAFENCTSLTDVPTAPNIGAYAYANCPNLPLVVLPSDIKVINNHTFFLCEKLESADLPNGVESIGTSAFYGCHKLTGMTIPNSVKTIGYMAFRYCYSSVRFVIGTGITSIGDFAFADCLDLPSITINAINPPTIGNDTFLGDYPIYVPANSVNTFKSAWPQYASRIYPIEEPFKFKATYIGGQTYEKECDTSGGLTTGDTKPSGYDYTRMETAIIGECATRTGDYGFEDCSSLNSVTIPRSIKIISDYSFKNCSSLQSVAIPDTVRSINEGAFNNCVSLTSIIIPYRVEGIGIKAFRGCYNLRTVSLRGTAMTEIEDYAFSNCTSLESVTIPSSVTKIGIECFAGCSNLEFIICGATTPPALGVGAFDDSTCSIIVPAQSLNAYRTAENWEYYADRIISN